MALFKYISEQLRLKMETFFFFLYLWFFPWVLSWRIFHWGPRGHGESRPRASPEFVPGYTDLLSAIPAYNNPHPHRQSALQAPRGVPAVPGGLGSCAAVLSWPRGRGGLSPAESPDGVSRGACCCCGVASHQLLPFLSPSHTESSQSSRRAPRHWRKQRQRSQRVHGRLSPGKMQRGRVKIKRGRRRSRQADGTVIYLKCTLFCLDLNQSRVLTPQTGLFYYCGQIDWTLWELDSFRIFFHQHLLPPRLTQRFNRRLSNTNRKNEQISKPLERLFFYDLVLYVEVLYSNNCG